MIAYETASQVLFYLFFEQPIQICIVKKYTEY